MTAEESEYWAAELGNKKKWKYKRILADSKTTEGADKITANLMTAETTYVPYYKPGKLTTLPFKTCVYKTKSDSGKTVVGRGTTDFINKKYYEQHKCANYNFEIFGHNSSYNSKYFNGENYNNENMFSSNNMPNTQNNSIIVENKYSKSNDDIFIDVDNDGVNDFIIEPLSSTSSSKETNINTLNNSDDATVIDLKK